MKDVFLSVLTGFGCGIVFAAFKLPVPAPPVLRESQELLVYGLASQY